MREGKKNRKPIQDAGDQPGQLLDWRNQRAVLELRLAAGVDDRLFGLRWGNMLHVYGFLNSTVRPLKP